MVLLAVPLRLLLGFFLILEMMKTFGVHHAVHPDDLIDFTDKIIYGSHEMYRIPDMREPFDFPKHYETNADGLLALGGNLHPVTLINAYAQGIFPWFSENAPILWWHPDPRLVIFPKSVHFSREMLRILKKISLPSKPLSLEKQEKAAYTVTINKEFHGVIDECAAKQGPERTSTWITEEMKTSYLALNKKGFAHSVEVWNQKKELVGGLYGIAMGKIFFGESMFSHESNTSKIALFWLCDLLVQNNFLLIDCQVESKHLKTLGAVTISRKEFLAYLKKGKTFKKTPSKGWTNLSHL